MRTGVTLIETILVLTLLAAASATGLILFDGKWSATRHVSSATSDVANSLMTARNTAVNSQAIVRVRRDNRNGTAKLLITEQSGPYRDGRSWTFDLGTQVRLRGRPVEFQFRPDGTANRNVSWIVAQSGVRGQVDVAPVTGIVTRTQP
jgi:Tfp pilus assembly protein FimT